MRQAILVGVGVVVFASVAVMQTRMGTAADEAAIRKNLDTLVASWNKHDAKAVAATFAADADQLRGSSIVSGRAQIEKSYADLFIGAFKNATLKVDPMKVRFITADVAIADNEGVITGATNGTVKNHATAIYVRRNGEWMTAAQRLIPEP